MIAGLLLAAGHGRRFGGDKLLAPLGGRPVIAWSAAALAGAVEGCWVVAGPAAPELRAAVASLGVVMVAHAGRDAGMGSSIAAGVAALPAGVEACVIALADQPLVSPGVVRRLCDRWRASGAPVVAPHYRDGRGHPVLFARSRFAALMALDGDEGARGVIAAAGDGLALVEEDALMPVDMDTREALAALERSLAR